MRGEGVYPQLAAGTVLVSDRYRAGYVAHATGDAVGRCRSVWTHPATSRQAYHVDHRAVGADGTRSGSASRRAPRTNRGSCSRRSSHGLAVARLMVEAVLSAGDHGGRTPSSTRISSAACLRSPTELAIARRDLRATRLASPGGASLRLRRAGDGVGTACVFSSGDSCSPPPTTRRSMPTPSRESVHATGCCGPPIRSRWLWWSPLRTRSSPRSVAPARGDREPRSCYRPAISARNAATGKALRRIGISVAVGGVGGAGATYRRVDVSTVDVSEPGDPGRTGRPRAVPPEFKGLPPGAFLLQPVFRRLSDTVLVSNLGRLDLPQVGSLLGVLPGCPRSFCCRGRCCRVARGCHDPDPPIRESVAIRRRSAALPRGG